MRFKFIPTRNGCAAALAVGAVLAFAFAISGCSKKQASEKIAPDAQTASSAQTSPGVVAPPPQALRQPATVVQPDGQPDVKELNRCLVRWLIVNKRRPKDFADFAATAGVPIPPPPAGKQYVIGKNMHIELVSR